MITDDGKATTTKYVPVTPGGTPVLHIAADTEEQAIANLLEDAAHMPYDGWPGFKARGYTIEKWEISGSET